MSKYYNKPAEQDGYHFDSQAEARRFQELALMQDAGEIWNLQVHPRYLLQEAFKHEGKMERAIAYEADFAYFDKRDKCMVVEDVKGQRLPVYLIKRKLFLKHYPALKFVEIAA